MMSEWLKVMLEEIARKKSEAQEAGLEAQRRGAADGTDRTPDAPDASPDASPDGAPDASPDAPQGGGRRRGDRAAG